MRRFLLAIIFLFTAENLFADDFSKAHGDFFKMLLTDRADMNVKYLLDKGHEDKNTSAKFDLDYFSFNGEIPNSLNRDVYLRWGFDYGLRMYDLEGTIGFLSNISSEELHRIKFSPGFGYFINDNLLFTANTDLGLFTNFEKSPDFDQLKYNARAIIAWRLHPGSLIYAGLERSDQFDDVTLFPLFGIKLLTENGDFKINLELPKELRFDYNFTNRSQAYLVASIYGEKYRIAAGDPEREFNLFIQDTRVGIGANHWFTPHLGLNLEAGIDAGSRLEFETLDTLGFFGDLDASAYMAATFKIAL